MIERYIEEIHIWFFYRVQERYRSESPLGPGEREIQIPEHITRADSQSSANKTLLQSSQIGNSTESYENVVPPQKIVPSSDSYIGNDKFERLFGSDHIVPGKSSLSTGSSLLGKIIISVRCVAQFRVTKYGQIMQGVRAGRGCTPG